MKTTIYTILLLLTFFSSKAQDIITLKNGTQIKSKVIEVGTTEIKYKRPENSDGPTYAVEKKNVSMITYSNGVVDRFIPTVAYILKAHKDAVTNKKDFNSLTSTYIRNETFYGANHEGPEGVKQIKEKHIWVSGRGYINTLTIPNVSYVKIITTKDGVVIEPSLRESHIIDVIDDVPIIKRELKQAEKDSLLLKRNFPFYPLLDNPKDVKYIGSEMVRGTECHQLQCTLVGPKLVDVWIDTKTYYQVKMADHNVDRELVSLEYSNSDGYVFPSKLTLRSKSDTTNVIYIQSRKFIVNRFPIEGYDEFLSKEERKKQLAKEQKEEYPVVNLHIDDLISIELDISRDEFIRLCTERKIPTRLEDDDKDIISFGGVPTARIFVEDIEFEEMGAAIFTDDKLQCICFQKKIIRDKYNDKEGLEKLERYINYKLGQRLGKPEKRRISYSYSPTAYTVARVVPRSDDNDNKMYLGLWFKLKKIREN